MAHGPLVYPFFSESGNEKRCFLGYAKNEAQPAKPHNLITESQYNNNPSIAADRLEQTD